MDIEDIRKNLIEDPRNLEYSIREIYPIFQVNENSKILIISQAPGRIVEESGVVFTDKSGENLVDWMGIDMDILHSELISVLPMDFYFPGKGKSGDLPPRKFIAKEYHKDIIDNLNNLELIILVGLYSQKYYLGNKMKSTLTETVKNFNEYLPDYFPIVHPSPRNNIWMVKNEWFKEDVIPILRSKVNEILF